MVQHLDDLAIKRIMETGTGSQEADYRRKRSLKFRAKMRQWRQATFANAFFKPDRTVKSELKVLAAKRRKRDDGGKFNFEAKKKSKEVKFNVNHDMGSFSDRDNSTASHDIATLIERI